MSNLLRKKNFEDRSQLGEQLQQPVERPRQQVSPAPGAGNPYRPELVGKLKSDHKDLLNLYGEIKQASDVKDFQLVGRKLRKFRILFNGHILTENTRLYSYMERILSRDPVNASIIKDFKSEMNDIGIVVHNFLKKYESVGINPELAQTFGHEWAGIGTVLVKRVQQEEGELYPLYAPA
jgi:hypothetical protein